MAQQTQEQDINHLLKVRREKLAELQQNGRDPFQITKFDQTHHSLEVKGLYEAHETELLKDWCLGWHLPLDWPCRYVKRPPGAERRGNG